ncbi:putative Beta-galactosidase [Cocos nucifera]|uniref:Putative Beta-galactosidase n=1 Tax=Cocos nucifera TaxID=13894 RepID=A0A8K0IJC3_COCNU|nr:putative Beta-galactosidase [Cocos nucifera]
MTLRVNTTGHILHAVVNGRLVGRQCAANGKFRLDFQCRVVVKPGKNHVSWLSATVGLKIGLDGETRKIYLNNPKDKWHSRTIPMKRPFTWYKDGELNTLILFEEDGGNPSQVSFQTVTIGTICATADQGKTLSLSCQGGQAISKIDFASFGNCKGNGRAFEKDGCDSTEAYHAISKVTYHFA